MTVTEEGGIKMYADLADEVKLNISTDQSIDPTGLVFFTGKHLPGYVIELHGYPMTLTQAFALWAVISDKAQVEIALGCGGFDVIRPFISSVEYSDGKALVVCGARTLSDKEKSATTG